MKSYYTDYTNHMLRVYFARPVILNDCEKRNVDTVKRVLEKQMCAVNQELLNECIGYVYAPPCEDFAERVEQFASLKGIRARDVYAILAKLARTLAMERGLL